MNSLIAKAGRLSLILLALVVIMAGGALVPEGKAFAAQGVVVSSAVVSSPESQASGDETIDFRNAKPMPLPMVDTAPAPAGRGTAIRGSGTPGFEPGATGTGKTELGTTLPGAASDAIGGANDPIIQEYGTSDHPFTTSRVDLSSNTISKLYPYRAAGKLYFKIGPDSFVCSASLIQRGLIVTAAHCVANFGQQQFYSNWKYVPALSGATAPYGTWNVRNAFVMTSYYDGTDVCTAPGVVCTNDVAVLVVKQQNGVYPGTSTGYLGYGWDGYGFSSGGTALINQLGYPVSHDSGKKMQRTDSQGFVSVDVDNTVWGSRQTGGSSGGPEVVNLGRAPVLSGGVGFGTDSDYNIVVGVTSWGYVDQAIKQEGASAFTSGNIVILRDAACTAYPKACQ